MTPRLIIELVFIDLVTIGVTVALLYIVKNMVVERKLVLEEQNARIERKKEREKEISELFVAKRYDTEEEGKLKVHTKGVDDIRDTIVPLSTSDAQTTEYSNEELNKIFTADRKVYVVTYTGDTINNQIQVDTSKLLKDGVEKGKLSIRNSATLVDGDVTYFDTGIQGDTEAKTDTISIVNEHKLLVNTLGLIINTDEPHVPNDMVTADPIVTALYELFYETVDKTKNIQVVEYTYIDVHTQYGYKNRKYDLKSY